METAEERRKRLARERKHRYKERKKTNDMKSQKVDVEERKEDKQKIMEALLAPRYIDWGSCGHQSFTPEMKVAHDAEDLRAKRSNDASVASSASSVSAVPTKVADSDVPYDAPVKKAEAKKKADIKVEDTEEVKKEIPVLVCSYCGFEVKCPNCSHDETAEEFISLRQDNLALKEENKKLKDTIEERKRTICIS